MSFTDLTFLFIFLPVALFLYYIAAKQYREIILLALSLLFYACGSMQYVMLLIVAMAVTIGIGYLVDRFREKRLITISFLVIGIVFNVAILGYYKYFDFAITTVNRLFSTTFAARDLVLPLGLSFYIFKAISYLVDVYRGKAEANHPLTVALYLSFFAQISSGPIARYETVQGGYQGFDSSGIARFIIGFGKKVLIANSLDNVVTEIFDNTSQLSTSLAWLGAICYSLQLYYDFSGYSDMAIGICGMFGYECPENFNYPYITKSFSEFWRRWHITLGSWFRDYIYIPMGGSRVGKARLYINLFVVWMLTGLWHGANWNYVAWGLGYFILVAFEKMTGLPKRLKNKLLINIYRIVVLLGINFLWVMFRSSGFGVGLSFIKTMIISSSYEVANARAAFLLEDYIVFIVAAVIFAMPVIPAIEKQCLKHKGTTIAYNIIFVVAVAFIFVGALSMVASGQNNPFLYSNF